MRKAALLAMALLLPACSEDLFNPLEENAEEAGITVEVLECDIDETSGLATATAQVQSEQSHDTVLLRGELIGADETVLMQSSTSVSNVEPEKKYRARLVFGSLSKQEQKQDVSCDVQLDFASNLPG